MSAELPSGMVTFVFTDIEGSTRLFRRIGDRYPPMLERHHEILRAAWAAHAGVEVKTEGDAFFVAFADAADAVESCARAQRDLTAESWPVDAPVRVRMALHSGLAFPRGDDYIAFAVHQAARVVAAGHGGQILVTADTARHAVGLDGVGLRSLGRFRVRDFDDPAELFQVVGLGLPDSFPALRVLPADRNNLVAPVTSMVGRIDDIAELAGLVARSRLVSVVGPGGMGKTRLVVEYGLVHAADWDHGVWFVDLAPLTDPSAVAQAVADAVAAPVGDHVDVWSGVIDHLADRSAVVIMDNCEHVATEAAARIDALLGSCPGVRVLATSREPLGLRVERIWRPRPLSSDTTAVELFCQRAGLDDPDPSTRAAVIELCERLDGLPLAIELAAARSDVLSPAEILTRLDGARDLLRSRDPTLGARQRNLDDLIEWSYRLLTPAEQAVFRRLGVFASGFDLEAATAAAADEAYDVPELVWSLQSKSLLATEPAGGSTRYRMLKTIRSFALRHLDPDDELANTSIQLGRHYMAIYSAYLLKLDASVVSDRARETDNLRNLVTILTPHDPELAQSIACTLVHSQQRLTSISGALDEGLGHLERLPSITPTKVLLLLETAKAATHSGRVDQASALVREAQVVAELAGLPPSADRAIEQGQGLVELGRGDPSTARSIALAGLDGATTAFGRSLMFNLLSMASADLGLYDEARDADERCLEIRAGMGDLLASATLLGNLAEIALRSGNPVTAAARQLEALTLALQFGRQTEVAFAIIIAARLAASAADWSTAVRLQDAADAVLSHTGYALHPSDRALCDDLLANAAQQLGPNRYQAELDAGALLPIEVATSEAQCVLTAVAQSGFHGKEQG